MNRKTKNILMVVVLLITSGLMVFTTYHLKNNVSTSMPNMSMPGNMPNNEGGEPPAKPGESENGSSENEPPAKPEENESNGSNMSEPPAKPDDNNESNGNMEKPSDMPNNGNGGSASDGNAKPEMPSNQNNSKISAIWYVAIISEGLVISSLTIYLIMSNFNKKNFKETFENKDIIIIYALSIIILTSSLSYLDYKIINTNSSNNSNMNMPGGNNGSVSYNGASEITENKTIKDEDYSSESSDENALLIRNADVTLTDINVTKEGDSNGGDNTSFYGTNSGILAKDGANVTIDNATIETNANGANGIFSYGGSATTNNTNSDGTTITISNSKITTTKDNAGGIMTTGGGTTIAKNLTINTSGTSSAAIRSDRGGGTVTVDGGTYKTTGKGSPTVYSTANITVKNSNLIATASEGIVIEGKNSVTLENSTLTDTNSELNGKSTTYKNIFLYQSMSGDASDGVSNFTANNSTITTNKGDTFYITNTSAIINLVNNKITNNDSTGSFLRAQSDSWGNSGSNGADVTLNMSNQSAAGNIVVDKISTLIMNLSKKSSYTGTINGDNTAKNIELVLDKTSKIKLTGDSYVTKLTNSDSSNSNIDFNGYKLYVNGVAVN